MSQSNDLRFFRNLAWAALVALATIAALMLMDC